MMRPTALLRAIAPARRLAVLPQPTSTTTITTTTTSSALYMFARRNLTTTTPLRSDAFPSSPSPTSVPPAVEEAADPAVLAAQEAAADPKWAKQPIKEGMEHIRASFPWRVARTNAGNLPIFQQEKRGGNLPLTVIKKVEGDVAALRNELSVYLKLEHFKLRTKTPTNHIEIRGKYKYDVKKFLHDRGF
ncbi:mitochondrial large subunit ribosomal protein-domain-containing protein [Podospora didyma]|uniref:Large ribosomal subunit protein mL49 n=1 Tax=Podospora didyma TaxID=330526 RepID=A0AAE0U0C6_9PEZI|nr:mitochondrial large subunit ribosomal protein-domain-containing protein [Podospora didyma]